MLLLSIFQVDSFGRDGHVEDNNGTIYAPSSDNKNVSKSIVSLKSSLVDWKKH